MDISSAEFVNLNLIQVLIQNLYKIPELIRNDDEKILKGNLNWDH